MIICPADKCSGCAACVNVCVVGCISLHENEYGELHPVIDAESCVKCGRCSACCPNNQIQVFNEPMHCFAAFNADDRKRRLCASGGIATLISEYVISCKNGVVYGTAYNDEMIPTTTFIDSIDGLERLKGSKYAQSVIPNDLFRRMKMMLDSGRYVLYIATPCQIAAALSVIGAGYDNFMTVDLICHGACPSSYFKKELEFLKHKYNLHDVGDVRFRGNDKYNYKFSVWDELGGTTPRYAGGTNENYYLWGFLNGLTLRESCYTCNYSRPDRIADITVGDYIGLAQDGIFRDQTNVSVVLVNTPKGDSLFRALQCKYQSLVSVERPYVERLNYKPSLLEPCQRNPLRKFFLKEYLRVGFRKSIVSVVRPVILRRKFSLLISRLSRVPRRLMKIFYRFE